MDSLENLKKNIKSAKELQNIISTMKAVASVNIKKYEKTALTLYKYRDNIDLGIQAILQKYPIMLKYIDYTENTFEKTKKKNMVIVIGSNQGLCGRFNDKNIEFFIENESENKDDNYVITIGDRIESIISSKNIKIDKKFSTPNSLNNITSLVYDLFELIETKKQEIKKVVVYFTSYSSKSNGNLTKKKIFPLEKNYFEKLQQKTWPTNNTPFWRIESKNLISDLVEQYIFCNLYISISGSMAAEQRNRLITLQGAEENIKEHMNSTILKYNQTRQGVITSELIDVVTGAKFSKKKTNDKK